MNNMFILPATAAVHELINSLNAKAAEDIGSDAMGVGSMQDAAVSPTSPGSPARPGKLIVVANRLPLSISKGEDGKLTYKMSSGGLVSALMSIRDKVNFVWLGWLGKEVADEDKDQVRQHLYDEYRCVPVFITDELADAYYNGCGISQPHGINTLCERHCPTFADTPIRSYGQDFITNTP
jgi:hypothetical protein